jgi:hypothetical protein
MELDARVVSLQLAKLYGTLFPEDRRLTLNAHDAGVDVTMTIRLVKAYLLRPFGMPLMGKLISTSPQLIVAPRDGNWTLGSCLAFSKGQSLLLP